MDSAVSGGHSGRRCALSLRGLQGSWGSSFSSGLVLAGKPDAPWPPQGRPLTGHHLPQPPGAEIQGTQHLGDPTRWRMLPRDTQCERQGQTVTVSAMSPFQAPHRHCTHAIPSRQSLFRTYCGAQPRPTLSLGPSALSSPGMPPPNRASPGNSLEGCCQDLLLWSQLVKQDS